MDPVVSTEWLAGQLDAADLVVFDATLYLPHEGRDAGAEFGHAHIPGARLFDVNDIADADTDLPHMVPSPGRFAQKLGALGVSNASRIVFYDQKGLFSAARGWWMMGLFGHDEAGVLDGGLPKWVREGRPTESGAAASAAQATFRPNLRAARLRGLGDMRHNAVSRDEVVLDARTAARFTATAPEPRPGLPGGHIPGARSLPFTDLIAPDGTLLPKDKLLEAFNSAGVDGSRPVVTSCGSGVTATMLTLGLAQAGLPVGAVYDGSWTEWALQPDTVKEV